MAIKLASEMVQRSSLGTKSAIITNAPAGAVNKSGALARPAKPRDSAPTHATWDVRTLHLACVTRVDPASFVRGHGHGQGISTGTNALHTSSTGVDNSMGCIYLELQRELPFADCHCDIPSTNIVCW